MWLSLVIAVGLMVVGCLGGMAGLAIEGWLRARRERRAREARWLACLRAERRPVDVAAGDRLRAEFERVFGA